VRQGPFAEGEQTIAQFLSRKKVLPAFAEGFGAALFKQSLKSAARQGLNL
jgi:hypothetical protein